MGRLKLAGFLLLCGIVVAVQAAPGWLQPTDAPRPSRRQSSPAEDRQWLRVHYESESHLAWLRRRYDVVGVDPAERWVDLVVTESERQGLLKRGHRAGPSPRARQSPAAAGYFNYPDIVARLRQLQSDYPEIAQAVNLNEMLGTSPSVEERALWALKLSDHVAESEDEPAVVIDGLHHARELVTPHAVIDVAELLTGRYGREAEATRWVDAYEIWLVPCVNPDGLAYVFSRDRNWRKNRRPNGNGTFGVDPNRNYPFGWGACGSTSDNPASEVYRGPAPASEPEVQTMLALGARKRPIFYLTYHSFGNEVLFPYRCADLAERPVYYAVRDQYAAAMRHQMRLASASGESFEHFYNQFGSLAFLTEIGTEFQPPFSSVPVWVERLRPGWQYLLGRGLGAAIQGHVRNAATGGPVPTANISIDGIRFTSGEIRQPEPVFGRYHWIVQPGTYTIRFTAPGFQPQAHTVTVNDAPATLDVELSPVMAYRRSAISGQSVGVHRPHSRTDSAAKALTARS
jgi:hypothetical protein